MKSVRRAALRRCAEWIIARQEKDGCWGGIQPPWVYSLMALNLLGYGLDHPVMAKGIAGLDRYTITEDTPDGPVRRLEACQSPVWDTVLTMTALADAGLAADDPSLTRAARWVLGRGDPRPGRLAGAPAGRRRRRLGVRVRQRQLPRHRRHRRGGARAAPGRPTPSRAAIDRGAGLAGRDAVQGRRLGRVRRGQHPQARQQAAVLRLRRGHRPALGRRDRAHRGGVRRRGAGRRAGRAPRRGLAAAGAGDRTGRGSAAGARTTSTAPAPWCPR